MKQDPLFEQPPKPERPLSAMYSIKHYRASKTAIPKWTEIRVVKPDPCQECFANQHESTDALPRAKAKTKRTIKVDVGKRPIDLRLCRVHAELWRVRDEEDTA